MLAAMDRVELYDISRIMISILVFLIRMLSKLMGIPFEWVLASFETRKPLYEHICCSSKKCNKCSTMFSNFKTMLVCGRDFSFPLESDMMVSDVCTGDDWCSWNITFVGYSSMCRSKKRVTPPKLRDHCSELSITANPDFFGAFSGHGHCNDRVGFIDSDDVFDGICAVSDSKKKSPDHCFPSSDEDSFLDSDYSEPTSDGDDDDNWSDTAGDSDEDFSIVFDDDFSCSNQMCEEKLIIQSNVVMNIETNSSSIVFEDIPEFCFHELMPYCTVSTKGTPGKTPNLSGNHINDIFVNNVHNFIICQDSGKTCGTADSDQISKSNLKKKCVMFEDHEKLETVHPMIKWAHAYRQARKGNWEKFALDRCHFQRRIRQSEEMLADVIEKKYKQFLQSN